MGIINVQEDEIVAPFPELIPLEWRTESSDLIY